MKNTKGLSNTKYVHKIFTGIILINQLLNITNIPKYNYSVSHTNPYRKSNKTKAPPTFVVKHSQYEHKTAPYWLHKSHPFEWRSITYHPL